MGQGPRERVRGTERPGTRTGPGTCCRPVRLALPNPPDQEPPVPRPHRTLSPDRAARLRPLLDRLDAALDRAARIAADPVEFPRAFPAPEDAEVAGLVAVSLAYG